MSEAPKAHVFEDSGQGTRHCAECGHHLEATWHFAKGSEHSALLDEVERLRKEPCACACHSVGGHTDEPPTGMALMDMTRRCLKAEADLDRLATDYTDLGELLFGEAEYEHGDVRPRVVSILDDLAAARAVLDSAQWPSSEANGRLLLNVDAAAWQAWKGLTP